ENLFCNVSIRKKALNSSSEELSKILDVVNRYAVHNPSIGFTLKKYGEAVNLIRTPCSSTNISNIRLLFGTAIGKELLEVKLDNAKYKFKLHALVTNANYIAAMKRTLHDMYSVYLPKKAYPWCYISLEIEHQNVDVNVHPTKNEVRFLHEEAIIKKIKILLNERLQNEFPQDGFTEKALDKSFPYSQEQADKKKTKKIFAKDMIRTSTSDQKLEKFNCTVNKNVLKSTEPEKNEQLDIDTMVLLKDKDPLDEASISRRTINKENLPELETLKSVDERKAETTFSSIVLKLQKEVEDNSDERLRGIISNLIFVGCIDQCSALIQSSANLYICLTEKLVEEVFYQIMLYNFANFGAINYSEPISIYELALLGLSHPSAGWSQEEGDKEKLAMAAKNLY
ncbi:hypothetical protein TSAR_002663, partial [Trichomalopsis sarcophagae]